ncbi:MAG: cyclase family protein [Pelolinea sp.]|nr:cyclase family protein [Pelolinea sp.]
MKIIDITIPLSERTPVWEGDKGISITRVAKIEKGSDFNVSRIELGVHTGTHIDGPFHLLEGGNTVDQIPLGSLVGKVQVVEIPSEITVINEKCLKDLEIDPQIDRILFKTSNSCYWETDPYGFNKEFVALNTDGAQYIADLGVRLIGVDYFSVSSYDDLIAPHVILLERGIILLENIDLRCVVPGIYTLICLPIKLIGTDGAPVRAVLLAE